jgi:hypothetical protein
VERRKGTLGSQRQQPLFLGNIYSASVKRSENVEIFIWANGVKLKRRCMRIEQRLGPESCPERPGPVGDHHGWKGTYRYQKSDEPSQRIFMITEALGSPATGQTDLPFRTSSNRGSSQLRQILLLYVHLSGQRTLAAPEVSPLAPSSGQPQGRILSLSKGKCPFQSIFSLVPHCKISDRVS